MEYAPLALSAYRQKSAFPQQSECCPEYQSSGGEKERKALLDDLRARVSRVLARPPVHHPLPAPPSQQGWPSPTCSPSSLVKKISNGSLPIRDHDTLTGCVTSAHTAKRWCFGIDEIDWRLPDGVLNFAGVHEIKPSHYSDIGAALGFTLRLIVRRLCVGSQGAVLWCGLERESHEIGMLHGPGLLQCGLDPSRLMIVQAAKGRDVLWAMEEGLKANTLAAVVGLLPTADLTAARRLALAAQRGATPCLAITHHKTATMGVCLTRWRIARTQSGPHPFVAFSPGNPRWCVTLERVRHGGGGRSWVLEWCNDAYCFRLAATLADRAPETSQFYSHTG